MKSLMLRSIVSLENRVLYMTNGWWICSVLVGPRIIQMKVLPVQMRITQNESYLTTKSVIGGLGTTSILLLMLVNNGHTKRGTS